MPLSSLKRAANRAQDQIFVPRAAPEIAITVVLKFSNISAVVIVCDVMAPVIPQPFCRIAFWGISRDVSQAQTSPVAAHEFSYPLGGFGAMESGTVSHDDDAPPAAGGTQHALLYETAEGCGISPLAAHADDVASSPINRRDFVALGWMHTGRLHLTLLPAQHPHTR